MNFEDKFIEVIQSVYRKIMCSIYLLNREKHEKQFGKSNLFPFRNHKTNHISFHSYFFNGSLLTCSNIHPPLNFSLKSHRPILTKKINKDTFKLIFTHRFLRKSNLLIFYICLKSETGFV